MSVIGTAIGFGAALARSLGGSSRSQSAAGSKDGFASLSEEQKKVIEQLEARDRTVRDHEQAHVRAGGQYILSGPNYTYAHGPDGRSYAIGGEVRIDTSPVPGDPAATLEKARQIRQAALAPAEPSSQDLAVAALADALEAAAQAELRANGSSGSAVHAARLASTVASPVAAPLSEQVRQAYQQPILAGELDTVA